MADQKLTQLTEATTIASGDLLYGVIGSNSRRITRDNFCANMGPIVSSGTATATKLVPTGNVTAGNGMYLPAANTLAFGTNGSERMRILSDGKIGFNTSSPATAFSNSDTAVSDGTQSAGSNSLNWRQTNSDAYIAAFENIGTGNCAVFKVVDSDSARRVIRALDGSNNTLFTVQGDGNVGIGTTSPNARLEVAGNIHVSGGDRTIFNRSNNSLAFGTNNTARMQIAANGVITAFSNVLNLQSETYTVLQVQGCGTSAGATIQTRRSRGTIASPTAVQASDEIGAIQFRGHDGTDFQFLGAQISCIAEENFTATDRGYSLTFRTTPLGSTTASARLFISPSGQIGIASATPNASAQLDVVSTTRGFLPPRMTGTQRDNIATPAAGLIVYNTTSNKLNFYNGSAWRAVDDSAV